MGDSSELRNPLERLAEEFLDRRRRGEDPTVVEYVEQYPDLAQDILDLFPTLLVMEEAKVGAGAVVDEGGVFINRRKVERLGDYRLLRKIGEGGMGIVFEAQQVSLERHVALKVLSDSLDSKRVDRFLQESRAAARLHHTNIVPVFGVGEEAGFHYYVMQFINGAGLDEVMAELQGMRRARRTESATTLPGARRSTWIAHCLLSGRLSPPGHRPNGDTERHAGGAAARGSSNAPRRPPGDSGPVVLPGDTALSAVLKPNARYFRSVAQIGVQVADALSYAHSQGTLHRDIKPSNLILDTSGRIWVTDFGLAKVAEEPDLTRSGDVVGTLRYLAPERFKGDSSPSCDIYGIGLTLYELIALQPAFDARDRTQLIRQITEGRIPRPRRIRPETPTDLERIVLKAIEPEPRYRYPTAEDLARDLRNYLDDRPLSIRRALPTERLWRWCRRNPLVASLLLTVALLMTAITVGSIRSANRLYRERESRCMELADKLITTPAANLPLIVSSLEVDAAAGWRESTLPRLRRVLEDPTGSWPARFRAAVALSLLGEANLEFLLSAVPTVAAEECGNLARALMPVARRAVPRLLSDGSHEADPELERRLAVILLGLGEPALARELLVFAKDPDRRTAFVHAFRSYGPELSAVPALLREVADASFRSGMCVAIGSVPPASLPGDLRSALEETLRSLYLSDRSSATHSAAGWALRRWQAPVPRIDAPAGEDPEREWWVDSVGMHMLRVPSGLVSLGDSSTPSSPPRPVYLTRHAFLADTEVSVALYRRFLEDPEYPAYLKPAGRAGEAVEVSPTDDCPVQNVSAADAFLFCNWLSHREGRTPCYERLSESRWRWRRDADGYRLPTEAEWEAAARAGTRTAFPFGDGFELAGEYANLSSRTARPVGERMPNAWGFFDLTGNVWERCWDRYHVPYPRSPAQTSLIIDPIGYGDEVSDDDDTAVRGGGVGADSLDLRSARRHGISSTARQGDVGFRVACSAERSPADDPVARLRRDAASANVPPPEVWRGLRRWYVDSDRLTEGAEVFSRLAAEFPSDGDLLAEHAALLTGLFRWDEAARQAERATEALASAPEPRGILEGTWWSAGLYREPLQEACAPELESDPSAGAEGAVAWRPVFPSDGEFLPLDAYYGTRSHVSAYALTHVYASRETAATLLVGSDDQVRVWIDGKLVHECAWNREANRDSDQVPVVLRAGWNKVLAKVSNHTVGYVLYLRISDDPIACWMACARRGEWERGQAALAAALGQGRPDDGKVLLANARALSALGRWDEAADSFRRAAALRTGGDPLVLQSGWWGAGPYPDDLEQEMAPERAPDPLRLAGPPSRDGGAPEDPPVEWVPTFGEPGEMLWLGRLVRCDGRASTAYAATYVYVERDQDATMLVGAEDRAVVWLNGARVHQYPEFPLPWRDVPVQDRVAVRLRKGWNRLLVKVSHAYGEEKVTLRLSTDPLERSRAMARSGKLADEYTQAVVESCARPQDPLSWTRLGRAAADLGEWGKAASAFGRAVETRAPSGVREQLLLARIAEGNLRDAAFVRGEILLSLSPTAQRADLARALWCCSLVPIEHADRGLLARLTRRAEAAAAGDRFALTALGAAFYRTGRYESALRSLVAADRIDPKPEDIPALTWYLLALVRSRTDVAAADGRAEDFLEKANRWTDDHRDPPEAAEGSGGDRRPLAWDERVSLSVLRKEAEALLAARPGLVEASRETREG